MPQRAKPPNADGARRSLWPIAEAAYLLGVSPQTLNRERDRGRITLSRVGARVYVTEKELRRYERAREREAS